MKRRICLTIDKDLITWLRKRQADTLVKNDEAVSFSQVTNDIFREAMMKEVNEKEK